MGQLLEAALAQQAVSQSHEAGLGLQGEAEVEVGVGAEAGAGLTQGETGAGLEKDLRYSISNYDSNKYYWEIFQEAWRVALANVGQKTSPGGSRGA